MRRPLRAAGLALVTAIAVAACGGSSSGGGGQVSFKGSKKIGVSIAQTGQSQLYGLAITQAVTMATEDINQAGGANGFKLVPDIIDDGTQVDKAVANTKQLILQDSVAAMVGPVTSGQCQATSPIAKQNKILMIASTCNSYQLTTEPDLVNPYYVSIVPNTFMEGTAAGTDVGRRGIKRIFIVSPNYLFGRSETNAFVAALKKANPSAQIINDPSTWFVPFPTNPRWDSTISAIQNAKPDLVYSNIFAADEINFIKQAVQVDPQFFQKYPMTTLASVDELQSLGKDYPLGMRLYTRAPFFALSNSKLDDFVKRYHDKYNSYPSDWALMAYDAVQLYAKAVNAAKSFDSDKVREQIVGKSFDSIRGYKFTIRADDQQANVGETIGTTTDSGGKYPFPIFKEQTNLKGDDLIPPAQLVTELKAGKCQKNPSDPTTTDFALCPSWKA